MYYFHFQTNISAAFINSLAVRVKIAGISVQIQYAWGKSIMITTKKKSIEAFLGHDRERKTASQDSSMTPQWAAHLECSSPAHTEEKGEKNYSPLEEEQVTRKQRTNNLSASHCVQLNKEQILHPNQALSSSKHDCSIVALWSPCHVGQDKTNVMSMQ